MTRLWFATGSQHLYGDDVLRQVDDHARQIVAGLAAAGLPVELVHRPVVTDAESIRRLCLEASADDGCVGVVAWMHTFSPARMWLAGIAALQKPLLHLHTQFGRELPWDSIDMDFMNLHQSAHGDRELGHALTRLRRPRKTVVGHWQDPAVVERLATWARAALGWHEAHRLRVARFGDNMRQVAVTEGDKVEAQARLGVAVDGWGVGELAERVAGADGAAVAALLEDYEASYELAPALRRDGDRRDALVDAARIEVGLRGFLDEGGFRAFTDTFEDLGTLPQLPGLAVQRLMADGYGFGAEGDWKTAALLRVLKRMAEGLDGGTTFMEDYTYHLGPGTPAVLGAHMLEVCPSIADGRPSCELHPLAIGGRGDPVRLVFTGRPGPAIVVALLDVGERFRLLVNEVDVVTPEHPLPRLPVARALWHPRPDLATAAEAWLEAGGPHHTVLTQALRVEHVADLAELAELELVVIDGDTTAGQLRKELRWNQAYHLLRRGP